MLHTFTSSFFSNRINGYKATFLSTFITQITQLVIRSWTLSKNEYFIFWWLRGPFFCNLVNFCHSDHLADQVEHNPKMSISFFDDIGLFLHFGRLSSLGSFSQLSEVDHNPKMSISFFNDLGDLLLHFNFHLKLKIRGFLFTVFDKLRLDYTWML